MIKRNEEVGLIHGCSVARGAPPISHLLFADDCYLFFRATESEATVMKNIINRYEELSGQAINFHKSTITYSPNTSEEMWGVICGLLGVGESLSPGKYLGLPMTIGRRKNEVFSCLTDRVRQKLQGWKNTAMSKAGKCVLLKTAAQSIPNFWMNLLLIPNEVCNTIQRQMNGFWWGGGSDRKGIRWMAWDRLCTIKAARGLGFKDLRAFNIAMLAKQGWRLINNVNPLVTGIMKARYYPKSDFLNANLGENPSYMWRSIFEAKDVVKQGCRKKIGVGDDTKVWKVPWLPSKENGYVTTDLPVELQDIDVQSLMQENGRAWDEVILNDIFNARDVQLIKNIPLPIVERKDSWMWIYDDKGEFTVKSCYRKLVGEDSITDAVFWRKLWNLDVPGKILFFIWRTCRLCLPTAQALIDKRVDIDGRCSWCRMAREDALHVLFECSFAKSVWESLGLLDWVQVLQGESIVEIFKRLFNTGTKERCVLVAAICWSIWNRRNKWVWTKIDMSVFGTKTAALNLITDWRKAQVEKEKYKPVVNVSDRCWHKPPVGWIKANVDAAIFMQTHSIGIGGIIRDEHGSFLRAVCQQVEGLWQPREAEAISLKELMTWMKEWGYTRCIFETDSKLLADAFNGGTGNSYFHSIVTDCIELSKHFDSVLVRFAHRSANVVAHLLARASHSEPGLREWSTSAPDFIRGVIFAEAF